MITGSKRFTSFSILPFFFLHFFNDFAIIIFHLLKGLLNENSYNVTYYVILIIIIIIIFNLF